MYRIKNRREYVLEHLCGVFFIQRREFINSFMYIYHVNGLNPYLPKFTLLKLSDSSRLNSVTLTKYIQTYIDCLFDRTKEEI